MRWLDGAEKPSSDFVRRVRLAEGFFVALCAALLVTDPPRGAMLWYALRETMTTSYIGRASVDERVLMLFRVPRSPTVLSLRETLLAFPHASTDERLFELAVAAIAHGEDGWLAEMVHRDSQSSFAWRRRRAIMLSGFGTGAVLPITGAVLEGTDHTYADGRRAVAARRLVRDAAARYWWRLFIAADTPEKGLAAWTLFRRSADRRALAWLANEDWPIGDDDKISARKEMHFELNKRTLIREAENREKDGSNHLLGKRISSHVAPWYCLTGDQGVFD